MKSSQNTIIFERCTETCVDVSIRSLTLFNIRSSSYFHLRCSSCQSRSIEMIDRWNHCPLVVVQCFDSFMQFFYINSKQTNSQNVPCFSIDAIPRKFETLVSTIIQSITSINRFSCTNIILDLHSSIYLVYLKWGAMWCKIILTDIDCVCVCVCVLNFSQQQLQDKTWLRLMYWHCLILSLFINPFRIFYIHKWCWSKLQKHQSHQSRW